MSTATLPARRKASSERLPLAEAALRIGLNRERLLRRIQTGAIAGGQENGFWYVERASLDAACAGAAA